jgi:triosephosphate isomerase
MNPEKNKIYVVGNWKMNPSNQEDAETLFDEIKNDVSKIIGERVETVVCPPDLFLGAFMGDEHFFLGGQNLFWESHGAFTGEISGDMLRRAGARYVIVGHSERRRFLFETDEMVNLKLGAALFSNLRPILCVGETLEERQRGDAGEVITAQLEKALEGIDDRGIEGRLLIAYEPVWAIGAGVTPTTDEVMSTGLLIRKVLTRIYGSREMAEEVPILYGGSVVPENCLELAEKAGLDGVLVGGASIRAREFMGIVRAFAK